MLNEKAKKTLTKQFSLLYIKTKPLNISLRGMFKAFIRRERLVRLRLCNAIVFLNTSSNRIALFLLYKRSSLSQLS